MGAIEAATWEDNELVVTGWACDRGAPLAIDLQVSVGGAPWLGIVVGAFPANLAHDGLACGTPGSNHGFRFGIPRAQLVSHEGAAVYVEGFSVSGGTNVLLDGSGNFRVPSPLPPKTTHLSDAMQGLAPGGDLIVAENEDVTINSSADLGVVTIKGRVRCPATGNFTIDLAGLVISGPGALFECGTASARFDGQLTLRMKPGRATEHGERGIGVSDGGALRWFGRARNFGWVHLDRPAVPGHTQLWLDGPVDWSPGDHVVLGPTGFDFAEAEERIIASVSADRRSVTVTSPLAFGHGAYTHTESMGARSWTLDQRAEVANLTRNIVITAFGDPADLDRAQKGAHVMVMSGGSAQIDGVEFTRGGQLGLLGRYPFHWHLVGDATGQFLKNSSIHSTYQRCVTLHGVNNARVENNVCFDHFGHGFFFEQGNEVGNALVHNLGLKSKRVPAGKGLLHSDMTSEQRARFSAPSTFWVANPQNVVKDNVASGSEGTGFWMAFSQVLACKPDLSCKVDPTGSVFPARGDTTEFSGNVAHSAEVGITWDGAEDGELMGNALNPAARKTVSTFYAHGAAVPVFDRLTVFKNAASGIYFRGARAQFRHLVASDNGYSAFFAYDQELIDSLVMGSSGGLSASDVAFARAMAPEVRLNSLQGVRIYDGPFLVKDTHFAGFQTLTDGVVTVKAWPFVNVGGANRWANRVEGATFDSTVVQRLAFAGEGESFATVGFWETPWTTAVRDLDGSLSGVAGSLLVPNHPLNVTPDCTALATSVADGYACAYDWGVLAFFDSVLPAPWDPNHFPFTVERVEVSTGTVVSPGPMPMGALANKTGLIISPKYHYRLGAQVAPVTLRMRWQADSGALSPMLEIPGAPGCRPLGAAQSPSVEALAAATTTGYAVVGNTLYVRVAPGVSEFLCQ